MTKRYILEDGVIKVVSVETEYFTFVYFGREEGYKLKQDNTFYPIKLKDEQYPFELVYNDHYGGLFGWLTMPCGKRMYIGFRESGTISLIKDKHEIYPPEVLRIPKNHPFVKCLQFGLT